MYYKGDRIMSKYEPLWEYVKENNKEEYKLSSDAVQYISSAPETRRRKRQGAGRTA